MKKWLIIAALFAVMAFAQLSATVTYRIEIYDAALPHGPVHITGGYLLGTNQWTLDGYMVSDGPTGRSISGVPGTWYKYVDTRSFAYGTTYNVTVTYGSQSRTASGYAWGNPTIVITPPIVVAPNIKPPER